MVKRIGGNRRKSRTKLIRPIREKGKISITRYLQEYKDGEKVVLGFNSAIQKGAYNPRYLGRVGIIQKRRGECYEITFNDGEKEKMVIVHPIHLRRP